MSLRKDIISCIKENQVITGEVSFEKILEVVGEGIQDKMISSSIFLECLFLEAEGIIISENDGASFILNDI